MSLKNRRKGIVWNVPDKDFIEYVSISKSWTELLTKCGYNNTGNKKTIVKRMEEMKLDYSHLPIGYYSSSKSLLKFSNDLVFCVNSTYIYGKEIKNRLYNDFNWERKCNKCNLTEWMGQSMPLELEHKNGIHNDNRIENLELLCPNCHALTPTYRGRNKSYKKKEQKCIDCNCIIYKGSLRCNYCNYKFRWLLNKNNRPTLEQLESDLQNLPFVKVGEKYDVSDNAIRKWIKLYKKYSD